MEMDAANPDVNAAARAKPVVLAGQQPASLIVERKFMRTDAIQGGVCPGRQRVKPQVNRRIAPRTGFGATGRAEILLAVAGA